MGKKAERIAYNVIETTLEQIGIVKFTNLFQEVVGDIGALDDGLDDISAKREKQFRAGIAKILKARKGAERDACHEVSDCGCYVNEVCDCCQKRIEEPVSEFLLRMQKWTGLHFSVSSALIDIMHVSCSAKKLTKKLRACQSIDDLATVINKKIGARVMIRETARGRLLPGSVRLTASSAAYVICLA